MSLPTNNMKNQFNEIYVELEKGMQGVNSFKEYFSASIIPKPETIHKEMEIIDTLAKHDISNLNLVLMETEAYRDRAGIFPQIGILTIILILGLIGVYCKMHEISGQIFFGICAVAIISEFFALKNSLFKRKCNAYIFLLKQAILLKGKN